MGRDKITVTLDGNTLDLLRRVGTASRYIDRLVESRWEEWQEALCVLRSEGWVAGEILAATATLHGCWMTRHSPMGPAIALELHDGGVQAGCEVTPERWRALTESVGASDHLGWAVWTVSREIWDDNEECERRVRALE